MVTRRRVLAAGPAVLAGCLGRECPGATYRLALSAAEVDDPSVSLDSATLSAEADAVVETALESEHVERCVEWTDPNRGTVSPGLYEVGERIADAAGPIPREGGSLTVDADRDGDGYRVMLAVRGSV